MAQPAVTRFSRDTDLKRTTLGANHSLVPAYDFRAMARVWNWSFMKHTRFLLYGIVVLVVVQCLVWLVAGSIVWSLRGLMIGSASPEAEANARFAICIFAAAAINVIALVYFLLRQRRSGWFVLVVTKSADVLTTLAMALLVSAWWGLITADAGVTITVLYLFRRSTTAPIAAPSRQAF